MQVNIVMRISTGRENYSRSECCLDTLQGGLLPLWRAKVSQNHSGFREARAYMRHRAFCFCSPGVGCFERVVGVSFLRLLEIARWRKAPRPEARSIST